MLEESYLRKPKSGLFLAPLPSISYGPGTHITSPPLLLPARLRTNLSLVPPGPHDAHFGRRLAHHPRILPPLCAHRVLSGCSLARGALPRATSSGARSATKGGSSVTRDVWTREMVGGPTILSEAPEPL